MAKKPAAKKRTVSMKSPADLAAWMFACLGSEWIVSVTEKNRVHIDREHRVENLEFVLFAWHRESDVSKTDSASTVVGLAQLFRSETWPYLQTEFTKWTNRQRFPAIGAKDQLVIESRQPRLTHKQAALPFHQ